MTSNIRQLRAKAQGKPRRKRLNFWVRNETRCFTLAMVANQLYFSWIWFKKVAFEGVTPVRCYFCFLRIKSRHNHFPSILLRVAFLFLPSTYCKTLHASLMCSGREKSWCLLPTMRVNFPFLSFTRKYPWP